MGEFEFPPFPMSLLEHVSGVLLPRKGEIWACAVNAHETAALVHVAGFRGAVQRVTEQVIDSNVNFSPFFGPVTPVVPPNGLYFALVPSAFAKEKGQFWWFRITTTSEHVVPSILINAARNQVLQDAAAYYAPTDFKTSRRVRFFPGSKSPFFPNDPVVSP